MNIDGERAYADKSILILAADQKPFLVRDNRFCVLQPLMTLEGDVVEPSVAGFPNRGRIWWMLRENIKDEDVTPGSIWTSTIENATSFESNKADADKYQVSRASIRCDAHDLLEIIHLPTDDPDLSIITQCRPITFPRRPTPKVFLRGNKFCLGPLKATWRPDGKTLELQPTTVGNPELIRVPTPIFDAAARTVSLEVTLGQFDPQSDVESVKIHLSRMSWLNLDQLREAGEVRDAYLDSQVINWALKLYGVTRSKGQPIKAFFNEIAALGISAADEEAQRKFTRLQELSVDSERILALGERVAAVLAEGEDFKGLVEAHLETVTAARVQDEIAKREAEIDAAMLDRKKQLTAVQRDLNRLSEEFEVKAKQQDEELQRRTAARVETLDNREKTLETREAQASQKEAEIHQRLDRLIDRYGQEAEKLADEVLLQFPVLRKLGAFEAPSNGAAGGTGNATLTHATATPVRGNQPCLPAYLDDAPPAEGAPNLSEDEFLRQFERVVQRRGFQFSSEDLKNFHTCSKIGGLTVLAGPSGTGKSSLPLLYAEALGWVDRFLHVAVRPDWLDDRDFVGAFNPLARRYEPSNSGLVDHLIAAFVDQQRDLGGIFLVALDEMNLARVEHYFAQFLSVLERPANRRKIALFAPGLVEETDAYHAFRELPIGENVRFVGTVNIDETTHFFSPKVLDRSQVVCLPPPDLTELKRSSFEDPIPGLSKVAIREYLSWADAAEEPADVRDFLLTISEALQASRLGLRARQFNRILQYVGASSDYLESDVALDYQIMQVVLPRLRRTAPHFDESVAKLRAIVRRDRFPRSAELLKRIAEPSIENDFFQLL